MFVLMIALMNEACKNFFALIGFITNCAYYPEILTPEEEQMYLIAYKNGDEEAKNILIERNMRLVNYLVNKKFGFQRDDRDDLMSVGIIGLMKAIATFDHGRNVRLGTYAAKCIENEILMYIRHCSKSCNDLHLNQPVDIDNEGNEITLIDIIDTRDDPVAQQAENKIFVKLIYDTIESILKDIEKSIIKLRFGILDGVERTQLETASILGISRSYVSRLESRALKKLSKVLNW